MIYVNTMTITGSVVQFVKSVFLQHSFSLADRMSSDPSHMSKFFKLFSMESLCEHVGCHFVCAAVFQFHGVVADLFSNEIIYMLRSTMELWILRNTNRGLIVFNNDSSSQWLFVVTTLLLVLHLRVPCTQPQLLTMLHMSAFCFSN